MDAFVADLEVVEQVKRLDWNLSAGELRGYSTPDGSDLINLVLSERRVPIGQVQGSVELVVGDHAELFLDEIVDQDCKLGIAEFVPDCRYLSAQSLREVRRSHT